MCDAQENHEWDWTQDMIILVWAVVPHRTISKFEFISWGAFWSKVMYVYPRDNV